MPRPRKIAITQKPDMVFIIPDFSKDRYRVWCSWNVGDYFELVPRADIDNVKHLFERMDKVITICEDGEMPEDYGY